MCCNITGTASRLFTEQYSDACTSAAVHCYSVLYRLSGTGSSGATIRLYIEQYTDDKARLKEDAQEALADIIKVGDD